MDMGITGFKVYMAGRGDFAEVKRYIAQYDAVDATVKGREDATDKVEDNTDDDRAFGGSALADHIVFCGLVDDMLALRKRCDVEIVASIT